jgi:glutaredoxin
VIQFVLAVVIAAIIIVIVRFRQKQRGADAPTQPAWQFPAQLDPADFETNSDQWMVVVFTSSTCSTCADVAAKAQVLESASVSVNTVDYINHAELHKRYEIDAVPITVIADSSGVVKRGFIGPVTATDLWAGLAEVREPGSVEQGDGCGHHE